jgi:hypothetical protein
MITRKFLQTLNFRPMDKNDLMGFCGCSSPVPLIAEFGEKYLVIIDGDYCEICDVEELEMVEFCDNIREL